METLEENWRHVKRAQRQRAFLLHFRPRLFYPLLPCLMCALLLLSNRRCLFHVLTNVLAMNGCFASLPFPQRLLWARRRRSVLSRVDHAARFTLAHFCRKSRAKSLAKSLASCVKN